jgi:aspartate 1-decarboxylase
MQLTMLKAKIHRATITEADLHYEGSFTIDEDLLEEAGILPYEKVSVVNINNGERFETYAICGERGKRTFCLNGAAARKGQPGDKVIIIAYATMSEDEAKAHKPNIILVDENNNISGKSNSTEPHKKFSPRQ